MIQVGPLFGVERLIGAAYLGFGDVAGCRVVAGLCLSLRHFAGGRLGSDGFARFVEGNLKLVQYPRFRERTFEGSRLLRVERRAQRFELPAKPVPRFRRQWMDLRKIGSGQLIANGDRHRSAENQFVCRPIVREKALQRGGDLEAGRKQRSGDSRLPLACRVERVDRLVPLLIAAQGFERVAKFIAHKTAGGQGRMIGQIFDLPFDRRLCLAGLEEFLHRALPGE